MKLPRSQHPKIFLIPVSDLHHGGIFVHILVSTDPHDARGDPQISNITWNLFKACIH
jgi:hypothetical protein